MTDHQIWWETTPAHFAALIDRMNEKKRYEAAVQRREDFRAGLIASVIYNSKLPKKKQNKRKEPLEWFGEKKSRAHNNTVDQQKVAAMNWAKALGGTVKRS